RHHIVLVGNPGDTPPSATFISLDTYSSLGKVSFTGATGAEQPLWDAQLHGGRFLMTVPGMGVVVINPGQEQSIPRTRSPIATVPASRSGRSRTCWSVAPLLGHSRSSTR